MKKEEFELQCKSFTPIIKELIDSNVRFYRYNETIKWKFGYDEDASIMAVCISIGNDVNHAVSANTT